MPVIDLTHYIVGKAGTWINPTADNNLFNFTLADTMSPERLLLRWAGDFVALTGPLAVSVTVQAENMTIPLALVPNLDRSLVGAGAFAAPVAFSEAALGRFGAGTPLSLQASTIYSYTLNIPAGQAWPFSLSEQLEALRARSFTTSRFEQLGNNLGYRVIIEPAFALARLTPVTSGADLPCDFAVADQPNTASFFPVACEPCQGSVIGLPPAGSVTLVTPPADGGCVRTRFFNGMFITREDLETEQRYQRLKSRLHNRAAGAGVVWGLGVGRQGSSVCVLPGYGVDCCGNDLALTTTYKVDMAALIADPAAASLVRQHGPQRMHVLLEYVECPAEPRPVHGDPCAPEASRCEMSRIRESVRLRLVPPRDYNASIDSAPIAHFLREVQQLQARFPLTGGPAPGPATETAPFQLRITVNARANTALAVRPVQGTTPIDMEAWKLPAGAVRSVEVVVLLDRLVSFIGGTLSGEVSADGAGAPPLFVVNPAAPIPLASAVGGGQLQIAFNSSDGQPGGPPVQLVVRLLHWTVQGLFAAEDDPSPTGLTTLTLTVSNVNERPVITDAQVVTQMAIQPVRLAPGPCEGVPCAPPPQPDNDFTRSPDIRDWLRPALGITRDPTPVLPWLHSDPMHLSTAGDPKALMLGALGSWLSEMLVRERAGTKDELLTARRTIAQAIYRSAWLLLFGIPGAADGAALGGALKRLLEGWCDGLLWTGPQCCGEPHGVVIGCAVVEGGAIQSIDPFGGRRHVVHYPLLEHWGAQFGLAPLDVTASRFFSKLCCLGALPALGVATPEVPFVLVPLGRGFLWLGDPQAFSTVPISHQVASRRTVGTPEMIATVLTLVGTRAQTTAAQQKASYTALVLGDFVADSTVMLLLPA
jgi:hypothetical protein